MTEQVKPIGLFQYVYNKMLRYGKHVLENRSIPDYRDGLKPVQRRILWAMYELGLMNNKMVKTARVVGDVLGKYHPHGDQSVVDAITGIVQQNTSPIFGEGNWGSVTGDKEAAYRYTLVKLSAYGRLFFDPFYLAVLDMVPTYDGAGEEPVILYPMLPHLLIAGVNGIGVGANTEIPGYTIKSVIATLVQAAESGGATAAMCCKLLEFCTPSQSVVRKQPQGKALMDFYKTGRAAIKHFSRVTYDVKSNSMVVTGVAPYQSANSYMERLLTAPENVAGLAFMDDQSKGWTMRIVYPLKRGADANAVKNQLDAYLMSSKHYKVNVTERKRVQKKGFWCTDVQFQSTTVPDIINGWLKWRVDLEVRATTHHLAELDKAIRRNEVLRLACTHRKFILAFTDEKNKMTDVQIKAAIKGRLKCTDEEAAFVFDMKWRALRTLEDSAIAAKMTEQFKLQKEYKQRIAKPGEYVIKHLHSLSTTFQ